MGMIIPKLGIIKSRDNPSEWLKNTLNSLDSAKFWYYSYLLMAL